MRNSESDALKVLCPGGYMFFFPTGVTSTSEDPECGNLNTPVVPTQNIQGYSEKSA